MRSGSAARASAAMLLAAAVALPAVASAEDTARDRDL
jgi:hypothetical protein